MSIRLCVLCVKHASVLFEERQGVAEGVGADAVAADRAEQVAAVRGKAVEEVQG